MDASDSPFFFEQHPTHSRLTLLPLINEGQWGNVTEVGNELIPKLEESPGSKLLVDLSRLDYMGSAQVALLVRIWKSLKRSGGQMAVCCPHPMVQEVLSIAGLKSVWQVVSTPQAGLAYLGVPTESAPRSSPWRWAVLAVGVLGAAAGAVIHQLGSLTLPDPGKWAIVGGTLLCTLIGGSLVFGRRSVIGRSMALVLVLLSLAFEGLMFWQLPLDGIRNLPIARPNQHTRTAAAPHDDSPMVAERPVVSEAQLTEQTEAEAAQASR